MELRAFFTPAVWLLALTLTLLSSGWVVRTLLGFAGRKIPKEEVNPGRVIGKLENVLVLFFVAVGEYTALALVFAAKGIARSREGRDQPSYYILGTLANFTWALVLAGAARLVTVLM